MNWTVSQSLVLIAVIQEIGLLDFVKIAETLNSIFSTNTFQPQDCKLEYLRISGKTQGKQIKECISVLNKERIAEIKHILDGGIPKLESKMDLEKSLPTDAVESQKDLKKESMTPLNFLKSLPNTVSTFAQGVIQGLTSRNPLINTEIGKLESEDENMEDMTETPRKSARFSNTDEKYKKWKSSCLLIFDKITDHRNGNVFLRRIKGEDYEKSIKIPMCLDLVKSRIRDGTIKTNVQLHRDLTLICANAIMYNQEGSDIYNMTLEFKEFIDSELQNFLIDT